MASIDLEKIRVEALAEVTENVKDDVYGDMIRMLLDASSQVTKKMLTRFLAELDDKRQ